MSIENIPNGEAECQEKKISGKTLERMRWYSYALDEFEKEGRTLASSQDIATKIGINPGLVRKDLCHFGGFGRPSVGYNIAYLHSKINDILKIDTVKRVAWIGSESMAGNPQLVKRFIQKKCVIVAVFDPNPDKTGLGIGELTVGSLKDIEHATTELNIDSAVIATSDEAGARKAANLLIEAGVKSILNISAAVIVAPPGVAVKNIDLVSELITLACQSE